MILIMTRRRSILLITTAALLLAGCQQQQTKDLEGVTTREPDRSELIVNVDQYPNMVILCIHGEGFVTTTRDYEPITHIPEWSAKAKGWCAPTESGIPQ